LINNLNDGMAWGLFPLFFLTGAGSTIARIGILSALYPATWGIFQLVTGAVSDRAGRKWMITTGMWVQAAGIALIASTDTYAPWIIGLLLMGIGTAQVYPTLLAAIGDVANPLWRASAVGVYRLWRDAGYAIGALISGLAADLFGLGNAILLVAAITFISGIVSAVFMKETRPHGKIC
jgi:MFS family permease